MGGRLRVAAWPAFKIRDVQPYTNLLYSAVAALDEPEVEVVEMTRGRLLRERFDIVHVHWPEFPLMTSSWLAAAWQSTAMIVLLAWARVRGATLVWTAHDLGPHEVFHPRLARRYFALFMRMVDGFISLSESGLALVRQRYPVLAAKPSCVTPHGHYRGEYPDTLSRAEARSRLGIDHTASVVAFFGMIRPYKNVPALIRAFRTMDDPDGVLLVAGQPNSEELRAEVVAAAGGDRRVRLRLERIPADDVQLILNAADLVVAPYSEIFNSGTALLALSFGRPVLVPALGSLVELQTQVGAQWVPSFAGDLDPVALRAALDAALLQGDRQPDLAAFEWAAVARQTVEFYLRLRR
jgi:glycosyltransferase involved in cell wall biosynthesis